jgi:hypothetical protein
MRFESISIRRRVEVGVERTEQDWTRCCQVRQYSDQSLSAIENWSNPRKWKRTQAGADDPIYRR